MLIGRHLEEGRFWDAACCQTASSMFRVIPLSPFCHSYTLFKSESKQEKEDTKWGKQTITTNQDFVEENNDGSNGRRDTETEMKIESRRARGRSKMQTSALTTFCRPISGPEVLGNVEQFVSREFELRDGRVEDGIQSKGWARKERWRSKSSEFRQDLKREMILDGEDDFILFKGRRGEMESEVMQTLLLFRSFEPEHLFSLSKNLNSLLHERNGDSSVLFLVWWWVRDSLFSKDPRSRQ